MGVCSLSLGGTKKTESWKLREFHWAQRHSVFRKFCTRLWDVQGFFLPTFVGLQSSCFCSPKVHVGDICRFPACFGVTCAFLEATDLKKKTRNLFVQFVCLSVCMSVCLSLFLSLLQLQRVSHCPFLCVNQTYQKQACMQQCRRQESVSSYFTFIGLAEEKQICYLIWVSTWDDNLVSGRNVLIVSRKTKTRKGLVGQQCATASHTFTFTFGKTFCYRGHWGAWERQRVWHWFTTTYLQITSRQSNWGQCALSRKPKI